MIENQKVDIYLSLQALEHFNKLSAEVETANKGKIVKDRALLIVRKSADGTICLEAKKQSQLSFIDTIRRWFYSEEFLLSHVKKVVEKLLQSHVVSQPISEGATKGIFILQKKLEKKHAHTNNKEHEKISLTLIQKILPKQPSPIRNVTTTAADSQKASTHPIPLQRGSSIGQSFTTPIKRKSSVPPHSTGDTEKSPVEKAIQKNLGDLNNYTPCEKKPSYLHASKNKGFKVFSVATEKGGASDLILLNDDITDNILGNTRKGAVVNAANPSASSTGGNITGALEIISNVHEWKTRTLAEKGGKDRNLEVGECLVIDQPFSDKDKYKGVTKLFHSLGRNYGSSSGSDLIKEQQDLETVYRNIFIKAERNNLDTVICPLISGGYFAPSGINSSLWQRLNASIFIREATTWLMKKAGRSAILIDYGQIPGADLFPQSAFQK